MRKDVKFGLTIGAILVVTLVVYVIVLSRGPSVPPKIGIVMPGPSDQTAPPSDSTPTPTGLAHSEVADNSNADQPPAATGTDTAAPPANDSIAPATQPAAADPPRNDWDSALNHGLPPSLSASAAPEHTVTPMIDAPPTNAPRPGGGVSRGAGTPMIDSLPTTQPAMQMAASPRLSAPAMMPADPQPAAPATGPRTHRVAAGESPYSISLAVYGNSKYYKKIVAANPGLDIRHLKIGQILVIPDLSDSDRNPTARDGAADASTSVDSSTQYKVTSGDTLESISRKLYGNAGMIDKIYDANKLLIGPDENVLKIGWVLKLPQTPTVASAAR
jgi:nucleoid-associated protein YgaU